MKFIGIDPGLHGALAWMDGERKQVEVRDCPLIAGEYDFYGMWSLFEEATTCGVESIVVMEKVHSMPSDGKCSAFSFGVGYGAWLAICGMFRVPPNLVAPQTWKRQMLAGIANDKQAEARALKQRFQGHPICAQLHGPRGGLRDGRVDALLLAEYARVAWKITGKRAA
jgi:hypothetical protein